MKDLVDETKVDMETITTALDHFVSTLRIFRDEFVNHLWTANQLVRIVVFTVYGDKHEELKQLLF